MDIDFSQLHFADSIPAAVRLALARAETIYDAGEVDRAVDQLAVRLTLTYQNEDPLLITLLPDGFVLGGMLMRRLVFPCQHVTGMVEVNGYLRLPAGVAPAGRSVVVLAARAWDTPLQALNEWALQQGAEHLQMVAMVGSNRANAAEAESWTALNSETTHVFGSGLAVAGYGANLPGLYHLPQAAVTADEART